MAARMRGMDFVNSFFAENGLSVAKNSAPLHIKKMGTAARVRLPQNTPEKKSKEGTG